VEVGEAGGDGGEAGKHVRSGAAVEVGEACEERGGGVGCRGDGGREEVEVGEVRLVVGQAVRDEAPSRTARRRRRRPVRCVHHLQTSEAAPREVGLREAGEHAEEQRVRER
jgi:hypothetical protein